MERVDLSAVGISEEPEPVQPLISSLSTRAANYDELVE
jgi:hypothetical protein